MNRDSQFACAVAPKRNSRHWRNTTVTWGEILDWLAMPDNVKESGNYLLGTLNPTTVTHNPDDGPCTRLHRNKIAVARRSALTLDLDSPSAGLPDVLDVTLGHAYVLHTTYSHTTLEPRYRLIIPLDREVSAEEYIVAARSVMQMLGEDNFDPSTDQPERYMFKPAAAEPATFQSWVSDGGPAVADDLLADFNPDLSAKPMPKPSRGRRSPYDLEGIVGAFNKAYEDWQVLIEEYELPYVPAGDGRWHLQGAASVAGMGVVGDTGFVYSHHVTDPAYGEVRSAFDLVRVHRYGFLDTDVPPSTPINKLPSYREMQELAMQDSRALSTLVGSDFTDEQGQVLAGQEWRLNLSRTRSLQLRDTVANWDLLREHDPVLTNVFFNKMTNAEETEQDLPWRSIADHGPQLTNGDVSEFMLYIEREYGNGYRPTRAVAESSLLGSARARPRHPVKEYLEGLEWDGVPRLEEALPCTPSPYSRMVARKCLVAAVARVYEPGVKWDHTLIFHGKEGLGKTFWMERMARGWTAPVMNIHDKDTLLNLQRCWIATSDEGGSMRKADVEALKEFLTRRVDVFRAPYDRVAVEHPRTCVVWGTTNDNVFLRKQEGNRRFLVIKVTQPVDFDLMWRDDYIDQVWAEAVHLYRQGEVLLFLDRSESAMAEAERASFIEEGDGLAGIISRYVNTMFPEQWYRWDVARRQDWMRNRELVGGSGTLRLDEVCSAQIWAEAMGREYGRQTRTDLLNINRAMQHDLGWLPVGMRDVPGYGPNLVFTRPHLDELNDLL